ncbi:hypothetical protein FHG87_021673 [Trinorchestia longiramus]|nr:hypothetical protein FHG87_021673 [Trinorchestia longiramus]
MQQACSPAVIAATHGCCPRPLCHQLPSSAVSSVALVRCVISCPRPPCHQLPSSNFSYWHSLVLLSLATSACSSICVLVLQYLCVGVTCVGDTCAGVTCVGVENAGVACVGVTRAHAGAHTPAGTSVSQSGPYRPPGGVEEMQGGGRRVRLEWEAYITV